MCGGLARSFLRRETEIIHISPWIFYQPDPSFMGSFVTWLNTTGRIDTETLNTKQDSPWMFLYLLELENIVNDFEVKETFSRIFQLLRALISYL